MTDNGSTPPARQWKLDVCGQTDLGRQRTNNEDNFLVVDLDKAASFNDGSGKLHDLGAKGSLLIVADGMGGANAGEVASQMAVEIISRAVGEQWSDGNGQVPDEFLPKLVEAVKTSNREIKARGMEDDTKRGMGSTCVVAGVIPGKALLCNVGDSRGYLLRGTEVKQLTHDQSFVQHLLDVGAITKEQAVRSPRRNVVMEALGAREEVNVAQVAPLDMEHGDILVLCSDGLTGHVEDEEILRVAYSTTDQKERCKRLIELANERGGKDNITVIVAEALIDGEPPVVRPQLPPIEPKPPEPPPDAQPEPPAPPLGMGIGMAMGGEEPLEQEPELAGQGREYSLATGFILGLSVGLVASVIFLGEHLRAQRDELQASYHHELQQKEGAAAALRMQYENTQKALESVQKKEEALERDVADYVGALRDIVARTKEQTPPVPDSLAEVLKNNAPEPAPSSDDNRGSAQPEPAPNEPQPSATPEPEPPVTPIQTMSPGPAPEPSPSPSPRASTSPVKTIEVPQPKPPAVPSPPSPAATPSPVASPSPAATPAPVASPAASPSPAVTPPRVIAPSPALSPSPRAERDPAGIPPSPSPSASPSPVASPSARSSPAGH